MSMSISYWWDRAKDCIGQGYCTNSKNPNTDIVGCTETHFERGYGPYLYTSSGTRWIDLVSGLGAIHFGYGFPLIEDQIDKVSRWGGSLSGSSTQDVFSAEAIKSMFYFIDRVKFVNDGTEACAAAVNMARAYTGRDLVCSEGYHGWSNEFSSLVDSKGVPKSDHIVKCDITNLESIPTDAACVIIEPVQISYDKNRIECLNRLHDYCKKNGIILIFDEVITGLRFNKNSVSLALSIEPDLICCGKAFGNGRKVGFVGGKSHILDGDYFVSGTYFSNIADLKAIEASIGLSRLYRYSSETLNERSLNFMEEFNRLYPEFIKMEGWGCRGCFTGSFENISLFRQELARCRIFSKNTIVFNHQTVDLFSELLDISKMIFNSIRRGATVMSFPYPIEPVAKKVRQ